MKTKFTLPAVLAVACVAVAGAVLWAVTRANNSADSGKLAVAASFYPLYDFAQNVGGDKIAVTNLTPAGAEPHDYEPSPRVLAAAQDSAVFIYNGGSLEPWVEGFLPDYQGRAVEAGHDISLLTATGEPHDHGGHEEHEEHEEPHDEPEAGHAGEQPQDPHFWLDPVLAQQVVANIRDGLAQADPANRDYYHRNAEAYIAKLSQLDTDFRDGLAQCQTRTIITSHQAFGYLAARYDLHVAAIAGLSPDQEPSAGKLAELAQLARDNNIQYVFFESLASPRLADTIAAETGAKTLVFDPIEGLSSADQKQGKDYLSVQRQNLQNLRTALACQ